MVSRVVYQWFLWLLQNSLYSVAIIPPSTGMITPLIMEAFSLSRNRVAFAMSSTSVVRRTGSNNNINHNVRWRIFWHMCPTKTQFSLHFHAVWAVFIVSIRNFAFLAIRNAPSENSDQTARTSRLILNFVGRTYPQVMFSLTWDNHHFWVDC